MAALARCRDGDPQRAVEAIRVAERPYLHVFIATSAIHLQHQLRMTGTRSLPRPSAGCVTGARRSGATRRSSSARGRDRSEHAYLLRVYEAVIEAGATTVNVPDTVGYAMPVEFGALVGRVVDLVGT